MSESEGRANHEHGVLSFLVPEGRALVGVGWLAAGLIWPRTKAVRR